MDDDESFIHVDEFDEDWEDHVQSVLALHHHGAQDQVRQTRYHNQKYERQASKNWNAFYDRHGTLFFRNRHYLTKEFPPLLEALETSHRAVKLLEVGCGVGNAIIPLIGRFENLCATGVDFAPNAIGHLSKHELYDGKRLRGFVCDISQPMSLDPFVEAESMDFVTMVFVLSALAPETMAIAIENVKRCLKKGGMILFRDYAQGDLAQVRFSQQQQLGKNLYVRQDGTRSFFFTLEGVEMLFSVQNQLSRVDSQYIKRIVLNRKDGITMRRRFLNACYVKPFF